MGRRRVLADLLVVDVHLLHVSVPQVVVLGLAVAGLAASLQRSVGLGHLPVSQVVVLLVLLDRGAASLGVARVARLARRGVLVLVDLLGRQFHVVLTLQKGVLGAVLLSQVILPGEGGLRIVGLVALELEVGALALVDHRGAFRGFAVFFGLVIEVLDLAFGDLPGESEVAPIDDVLIHFMEVVFLLDDELGPENLVLLLVDLGVVSLDDAGHVLVREPLSEQDSTLASLGDVFGHPGFPVPNDLLADACFELPDAQLVEGRVHHSANVDLQLVLVEVAQTSRQVEALELLLEFPRGGGVSGDVGDLVQPNIELLFGKVEQLDLNVEGDLPAHHELEPHNFVIFIIHLEFDTLDQGDSETLQIVALDLLLNLGLLFLSPLRVLGSEVGVLGGRGRGSHCQFGDHVQGIEFTDGLVHVVQNLGRDLRAKEVEVELLGLVVSDSAETLVVLEGKDLFGFLALDFVLSLGEGGLGQKQK